MKRFMMLQLFADTDSQEPKPQEPKPDDPSLESQKQEPDTPPKKEAKYTDEDVDKIINRKFAEWEKKQKNAVDEAKKLAEMNAQQKAEYERDQLKEQLQEYQKKETLAEMAKTARKMLSEENIVIPDELLSMMVSTDAEQTKAAVDGFLKVFKSTVEEAVKERLKGEPPRKGTGESTMTKEKIMEINDPELRQQKMLENRELFNF